MARLRYARIIGSLADAGSVAQRSDRLSRLLPHRELPTRPDEMAGVSAGIALQVVLVLGLRLPEGAGRGNFGHDLARPQAGGVDIGDGILGDPLLLGRRIEYRRAIARSDVVALAVQRRRIVNLEEELQQLAVAD